jgi:hypothetical protein
MAKVHHPKKIKITDLLHNGGKKSPNFGKKNKPICGDKNHCEFLGKYLKLYTYKIFIYYYFIKLIKIKILKKTTAIISLP